MTMKVGDAPAVASGAYSVFRSTETGLYYATYIAPQAVVGDTARTVIGEYSTGGFSRCHVSARATAAATLYIQTSMGSPITSVALVANVTSAVVSFDVSWPSIVFQAQSTAGDAEVIAWAHLSGNR